MAWWRVMYRPRGCKAAERPRFQLDCGGESRWIVVLPSDGSLHVVSDLSGRQQTAMREGVRVERLHRAYIRVLRYLHRSVKAHTL